jgi:hypothetical protein
MIRSNHFKEKVSNKKKRRNEIDKLGYQVYSATCQPPDNIDADCLGDYFIHFFILYRNKIFMLYENLKERKTYGFRMFVSF